MNRTVERGNRIFRCERIRRRARRRGFTLIELLVVIAVIALLVSLLMPSLKQAKGLARASVCGGHLRMVGTAAPMYMADWDDYVFPYSEWIRSTDPDREAEMYVRYALVTTWQKAMDPLRGADGFLSPYLPSNREKTLDEAMGCASVPVGPEINTDYTHNGQYLRRLRYRARSYSHNYYYTTWPGEDRMPILFSRVPRPAELVHLTDGSAVEILVYPVGYVENRWDIFTADIPDARHFDEFNMIFVDGHVESGTMDARFNFEYFATPDWGD